MKRAGGKGPLTAETVPAQSSSFKITHKKPKGWLLRCDTPISIWTQSLRAPHVTATALFFRSIVLEEVIFFSVPALVWLGDDLSGALFVLHQLGIAEVINGLFKFAVARPRPFWYPHGVLNLGKWEKHFSFPSSHAQLTAGVVTSAVLQFASSQKWAVVCAGVVILLSGVSRVYLGAHFASDVVVGWALGVLTPLVLHRVGVMQWFAALPTAARYVVALHPFALLGMLLWARRAAMRGTRRDSIWTWTRTARTTSPDAEALNHVVSPFCWTAYIFPACSTGGGALGYARVLAAVQAEEDWTAGLFSCARSDHYSLVLLRLLHGYVGVLLLGAGFFFATWQLEQRGSPASAVAGAVLCSTLLGLWVVPGNAVVARHVWGLSC